jgi:beta-galactosidase
MRGWGKGVAWVIRHCLGRFWNIGPTQTMYVPGPWLTSASSVEPSRGDNEILVLDLTGPTQPPQVSGLAQPILDQLRPDLDFRSSRRPKLALNLSDVRPVYVGCFNAGAEAQEVGFGSRAAGRFLCIESISAYDDKPFAAIADVDLLDEAGNRVSHDGWTVAFVDSEERSQEDGTAENAIDGQTTTFWHTEWGDAQPSHPHRLVLDLGRPVVVTGMRYVPRQGPPSTPGRIKDVRVYVGDDLVQR